MTVPPALDPRRWWADAVSADRLLLAAKTAVAAALAWYLAPFVPFAQSEYSYYAPLGVLVSMYPTVARSASSGVQALWDSPSVSGWDSDRSRWWERASPASSRSRS